MNLTVRSVEKLKKEYRYNNIYLNVYANNIVGIKLYKKIGFKFTREIDLKAERVMVRNLLDKEIKYA